MKSTGIVRQIDHLGRVVIPKELRNTLGIQDKDPLEIFVEGDRIVLRKYHPTCIFCGAEDNVTEYRDKLVCADCLSDLSSL